MTAHALVTGRRVILSLLLVLGCTSTGWSREGNPSTPSAPGTILPDVSPLGVKASPTPVAVPSADIPLLQESPSRETPPAPEFGGPLLTRSTLSGDWFGWRTGLAERGMTLDLFATQFYQGVASGGRVQEWAYGGKLDYLLNLDGGKMGMWQGFFVTMHAETRFGQSVNEIDGLLAPSNIAMQFPAPNQDITAITGLKITQALSENFAVFMGKINTLDEYPLRFNPALGLGRPGLGGFMNTSLVFNPILARTIPYAAAGVGAAYLREGEPMLTFVVFDPEERSTIGLQDLYARGAVLAPDFYVRTKFLGLPGMYNMGGTYSTARYRSTDPAAYLVIPPEDEDEGPQETGSWCFYGNFYQALWASPEENGPHWGLFGQFGLSDGNPNPVRYLANGGIAGRGLFPRRALDVFGVGYFYLGLGESFKALAASRIPQQDEYGVELFYNLAITPWNRLSFDLQVARPSTTGFDTVIIPGLRLELVF